MGARTVFALGADPLLHSRRGGADVNSQLRHRTALQRLARWLNLLRVLRVLRVLVLLSQSANFRLERGNPLIALRKGGSNVGCLEALRDVLRAVRVPGRYREQDHLSRPRFVVLWH